MGDSTCWPHVFHKQTEWSFWQVDMSPTIAKLWPTKSCSVTGLPHNPNLELNAYTVEKIRVTIVLISFLILLGLTSQWVPCTYIGMGRWILWMVFANLWSEERRSFLRREHSTQWTSDPETEEHPVTHTVQNYPLSKFYCRAENPNRDLLTGKHWDKRHYVNILSESIAINK